MSIVESIDKSRADRDIFISVKGLMGSINADIDIPYGNYRCCAVQYIYIYI